VITALEDALATDFLTVVGDGVVMGTPLDFTENSLLKEE
jgi:hypothetical protein